jgi:hypothetical protein
MSKQSVFGGTTPFWVHRNPLRLNIRTGIKLICGAFLVALLTFDLSPYTTAVVDRVRRTAVQYGILLSFIEPDLSFSGVSATKIGLAAPAYVFALELFEASFGPRYLALLQLKMGAELAGQAYGGKLYAALTKPLFGEGLSYTATLRAIDLALFPNTSALGIGGKIQATIAGTLPTVPPATLPQGLAAADPIRQGEIEMTITNGSKKSKTELDLKRLGAAVFFPLPPCADFSLRMKADWDTQGLAIRNLHFDSSWGSGDVQGRIGLLDRNVEIALSLQLSEEGRKLFSSYLSLVCPAATLALPEFELTVRGATPQLATTCAAGKA